MILWGALAPAGAQQPWIVHEWGTFTSLQDEDGNAIGGINTDDEPVPKFVHRLADLLLLQPTEVPPVLFQGAPHCHPDVTLRLETPVLYFHPPASQPAASQVTVRARFRGGWLTEFFPDANASAPGLTNGGFRFGRLVPATESVLAWQDLTVGGDGAGPQTAAHVWTSPRQVRAASVQTPKGESEKFLFYRGVAHIPAPLRIAREPKSDELVFRSQLEFKTAEPLKITSLWLVDIRPGGEVAFRSLPPITLGTEGRKVLIRTAANFAPADFKKSDLQKLKASLRDALVADGLFVDEAQALLDTWELSYFQSAGLRVFFIVPRAWTDHYLPLEVSLPADIDRVMVGRVELVTPEQRRALRKLAGFSPAALEAESGRLRTNFYTQVITNATIANAVNAGQARLSAHMTVPQSYQTYLNLGRFRNALVLDEVARHPGTGLDAFISLYQLQAYQPADISAP